MMYAVRETAPVKPNQVIQCLAVLWLRWRVPRRVRMKKYFAVICACQYEVWGELKTKDLRG
jgi:hypothetical protein